MTTMDQHPRKILIAIDDSEITEHAIHHVAQKIDDHAQVQIMLLHVAGPIPPKLLEFGGAENSDAEERREAQLEAAQTQWLQQAEQAAQPIFKKAEAILATRHLPAPAIEARTAPLLPGQDLATVIRDAAQSHGCDTVVVGRSSFSWWQSLSQQHVADSLGRDHRDFTLWVVEDESKKHA